MALLLVVGLLLPVLASPALAQGFTTDPMVSLLTQYNLVRGDAGTGNLRLQDPLNRAELAVLVVRIMGLESEAELLQGVQVFKDVPSSHWASGAIAVAQRKGFVQGYPDGTFQPKNNVNYAEMLTIFLRLLGKEPTTGTWPVNVLIRAMELNIHPPGVVLGEVARQPAIRLHVFQSLGSSVSTVPVTADGKTILQAHVDQTPPQLSVRDLPSVTAESRITVAGTVQDAVKVTVNGRDVAVAMNGFSTTVDLQAGQNEIVVEAFDMAGNKARAAKTVTRAVDVTSITLTGPTTVNAGQVAQYTVKGFSGGVDLGTIGLQARVDGGIGQFDLATGRLTAAATAASGRIVVTGGSVTKTLDVTVIGPSAQARALRVVPPNDGKLMELNKTYTVLVEVVNAAGQRVTDDSNREVVLLATGLTGVTISPTPARTVNGVATFTFKGTVAGNVTLTPNASSLSGQSLQTAVATAMRVKLTAIPDVLDPDGYSFATIRGTLVDAAGNVVANNTGADIVVNLSLSSNSYATLSNRTLTIRKGLATSSGWDGDIIAGTTNKVQVVVSGTVTSGQNITVEPVTVGINAPTLADAKKLEVLGPSGRLAPGTETTFTVRVTDANGRTVRDGSVAFQVSVSTSNNEAKVNGVPEDMTVRLGTSGLNPVDDGYAETDSRDTDDVIARTVDGVTTIRVTYFGSGTVTVTPVLKTATSKAYSSDGTEGSASSSTGLIVVTDEALFAGDPVGIKLVAIMSGLTGDAENEAGTLRNSTGSSLVLRALVVDEYGNWVTGVSKQITLTRVGGSEGSAVTSKSATNPTTSNGKYDFTIRATTTTGYDEYQVSGDITSATAGNETSNVVRVYVKNQSPPEPTILAVRGAKLVGTVVEPGATNLVAPDDDYMQIDVAPADIEDAVVFLVYREGNSTPIYTSPAFDLLSNPAPLVNVPKKNLPSGGPYRYRIAARNALGASTQSATSDLITNAKYLTGATISKAAYSASDPTASPAIAGKVTINGSGFSTSALIDPSKITISNGATTVDLGSGTWRVVSSSTITITDLDAATEALLDDPTQMYGSVIIKADTGWYTMSSGDMAQAVTDGKSVTPRATVTSVMFDGSRLRLKGSGFTSGSFDASKLTVTDGVDTLSLTGRSVSGTSDVERTIELTSTMINAIKNMVGDTMRLEGARGWFKDSSGNLRGGFAGDPNVAPVTPAVTVTSVSYDKTSRTLTIRGSGFKTDGIVHVGKLRLKQRTGSGEVSLVGTTDTVAPTNSTTIAIVLDPDFADTIEADYKQSYLRGDQGWYQDDLGLRAAEFGDPGPLLYIR